MMRVDCYVKGRSILFGEWALPSDANDRSSATKEDV
jgi:hypothetical protein